MTPSAALIELLARMAANNGAPAFVSEEELSEWPAAGVAALKSQKLLAKARPARSVVCPGCERECIMPVHAPPRTSGAPASFVVCDKRTDINRVSVPARKLKQWKCDAEGLVAFLASSLGLRRSNQRSGGVGVLNVGMVTGSKRSQMLSLRVDGAEWSLVAGYSTVPLVDVIKYIDSAYSVEAAVVGRLADSVTTADPRHTPSNARRETRKLETRARHQGWRRAYRQWKKQRPNMSDVWYSRQIAKQPMALGASAETIRKR